MKRLSSLARTRPHQTGIDRPQHDRLFEIDGGYVVVCGLNAGITSAHQLSAQERKRHVTLVIPAPEPCSAALEGFAAKAADICTRIVIYEPDLAGPRTPGELANLLARAVRSSARTECGVVLDASRALRHCIDGMAAGDIIVYCCDDASNAVGILDEYGAKAVAHVRPARRREPAPAPSTASARAKAASIALRRDFGSRT
jgi:hypothetical protein